MGAFYAVLAALFTALIGLSVKFIGERASTNTVLFVRYLLSFCLILPWIFKDFKEVVRVEKPI